MTVIISVSGCERLSPLDRFHGGPGTDLECRQTEEHHLIMNRLGTICQPCQENGRGAGEHPGTQNTGGIRFSHVIG